MKKILYIPLDSRPCNTTWVKKFAKRVNLDLIKYPQEKCGNLFEKANITDIFDWIELNNDGVDYMILSLDMLCSGGLVPSRLGQFDIETVKSMFERLRLYKIKNPKLKIYGFDTLMRTSVTSYNFESAKLWNQINMYSKLKGELHIKYDENKENELNQLINKIDSKGLNTFLKTREKKHEMNLFYINLVNENILDYLIILQEDSQGNGIQLLEQKIIEDKIKDFNLDNKVKLYNGTDEGASVLLAKIIIEINNLKPNIFVHVPNPNILDRIYQFEDRHFRENLNNMFNVIGLNHSEVEKSDYILSIYSGNEVIDLNLNEYKSVDLNIDYEYIKYTNDLNFYLNNFPKVSLLDLTFPNGGSLELLEDLNYKKLKGYSAWNTPSNSLGTLLCDMVCYLVNNDDDNFTKERILDDCIYQYVVRRKVNQKLLKENIDIFYLGEHGDKAIKMIREEFLNYKNFLDIKSFNIHLPWNRTFEIEIDLE